MSVKEEDGREEEARIQNKKQKPHTSMRGKKRESVIQQKPFLLSVS